MRLSHDTKTQGKHSVFHKADTNVDLLKFSSDDRKVFTDALKPTEKKKVVVKKVEKKVVTK